jgi:hypothetical protein
LRSIREFRAAVQGEIRMIGLVYLIASFAAVPAAQQNQALPIDEYLTCGIAFDLVADDMDAARNVPRARLFRSYRDASYNAAYRNAGSQGWTNSAEFIDHGHAMHEAAKTSGAPQMPVAQGCYGKLGLDPIP